jgi:hypothetical protein
MEANQKSNSTADRELFVSLPLNAPQETCLESMDKPWAHCQLVRP